MVVHYYSWSRPRTDQLIKLAVVAFIRHYCIVVTGMDYLPDPSVCRNISESARESSLLS